MKLDGYRFDGPKKYKQGAVDPADKAGMRDKAAGRALLEANKERIEAQQEKLYAEGEQALLVCLQAMDAAGKDGAVKHVFSGVNPQGVWVANFKAPTKQELSHDYLWRIHRQVPPRGYIGVFNRSHYEDVLAARVLELPDKQPMPEKARQDIWKKRYRQIREFERYLDETGVRVVKIYLHLSKEEQRQRLLARLDDEAKNWKFEAGDLATRELWDDYMMEYERVIGETAAKHAPWYVVPADHKWVARAVISEIVAGALEEMGPKFPQVDEGQKKDLAMYRAALEQEADGAKDKA